MAILDVSFDSEILSMPAELKIFLPGSGELGKGHGPYPTLWMLHGANADCNELIYSSSIARYAERYGMAVILPSIYNGFGVNMAHGEAYASFLEQELVDTIRNMLPCLSKKRSENYLAGVSMGGYAAFRWAMNKPQQFCAAGAFAGALLIDDIFKKFLEGTQPGGNDFYTAFGSLDRLVKTDNDIFYMAEEHIKNGIPIPKLYMVCGSDDFGFKQNIEARNRLLAVGCDVTWRKATGIHNMDCWEPFMPDFLSWLVSDKTAKETLIKPSGSNSKP